MNNINDLIRFANSIVSQKENKGDQPDLEAEELFHKSRLPPLATFDKLMERAIQVVGTQKERDELLAKIDKAVESLKTESLRSSGSLVRSNGLISEEMQDHLRAFGSQMRARKPLSQEEIEKIVAYVESNKENLQGGTHRLPKSETGLSHSMAVTVQDRKWTAIAKGVEIGTGSFKRARETAHITADRPVHYFTRVTAKPREDLPAAWQEARRQYQRELELLGQFKGQRGIMQLKSHSVSETKEGGQKGSMELVEADETLLDAMNQRNIPPELRRKFALDLLHGLAAVHQGGIAHLDVSLENVLLLGNKAMLADFGSAIRDEEATAERRAGKLPYMAPEVILLWLEGAGPSEYAKSQVGTQADMFSLGILLYEMKYGNIFPEVPEIPDDDYYEQLIAFCDNLGEKSTEDPEDLLIKALLRDDPTSRLTAKEALDYLNKSN